MHTVDARGDKVYGMPRSENRRRFHRTAENARPVSKTTVSGNKNGSTAAIKHRKHHDACASLPGTPGGVCVGSYRGTSTHRDCECSRCYNTAHPAPSRVIYAGGAA